MRVGVLLLGSMLPAAAGGEAVPDALQGRWAVQAGQCAVPGQGLTVTAEGLTFVMGAATLLAGVEASEAGEFRARLTLVSVVNDGFGEAAPQVGDGLVLERMGDVLQTTETVRGGVARAVSRGEPMVRCPSD